MDITTIDIGDIPVLANAIGLTGAIGVAGTMGGDTFADVIGVAAIVYEMYPPLSCN